MSDEFSHRPSMDGVVDEHSLKEVQSFRGEMTELLRVEAKFLRANQLEESSFVVGDERVTTTDSTKGSMNLQKTRVTSLTGST